MRKVLWFFSLFKWGLEMSNNLLTWDDACRDFNLGIFKVRYIEVNSVSPCPPKKRTGKKQAESVCQLEPRFLSASSYTLNSPCSEMSLSLSRGNQGLQTLPIQWSFHPLSGSPAGHLHQSEHSSSARRHSVLAVYLWIHWIPAVCALLGCLLAR